MTIDYKNGNVMVSIDTNTGTKIRKWEGSQNIEFPESLDVKITNKCDLNCPYCHENSIPTGKDCDVDLLLDKISNLPKGIELAIGGGNPLDHPKLYELLTKCKSKGYLCSITVNQIHLNKDENFFMLRDMIRKELIHGIGVSLKYENSMTNNIEYLEKFTDNIVIHAIAGINTVGQIDNLVKKLSYVKLLILGYKDFGRGEKFIKDKESEINKNISEWESKLPHLSSICKVLSFDNLSIQQLNLRNKISEDEWNKKYMGDDFTTSMYVDAVEGKFAPASISKDRVDWNSIGLIEYFKNNRVED